MPELILNADDFGFSPVVNAAIIQAHLNGIVSSSTVMINLPDAAPGLETALEEAPDLGLGLHLNLTNGKPLSAPDIVDTLVDERGQFYPIDEIAQVAMGFDGDQLYEEIAAQLERFRELAGRLPTHIDAHYHVAFMHPLALEATLALAEEYDLPLRETPLKVDNKAAVIAQVQTFMPFMPVAFIEELLVMLNEVGARSTAPRFPARFDARFHYPQNTLGDLLNYLTDVANAERPVEIMSHPGFANDPAVQNGSSKQREFDALTHPTTQEVLEKLGIRLVHFGTVS